eukprot:8212182-Pyramimonas_sp.AAC.1
MGETAGARRFQINPRNPKREEQISFNERLVDKSAGMPAPVAREDARVLSVTCSTTTAGLRAVAAGCKTHVGFLGMNGYLSKEKIISIVSSGGKLFDPPKTVAPVGQGAKYCGGT